MRYDYSINEILDAVNELQDKKKEFKPNEYKPIRKNITDIPENTLKLIEEAEKIKNKS